MTVRIQVEKIEKKLENSKLSGWVLCTDSKKKGRDAIRKTIVFDNFSICFSVMCRIAMLAEKMNHHPEWFNVYNKLEIVLSTHDVGGVSQLDFEMATEINSYLSNLIDENL